MTLRPNRQKKALSIKCIVFSYQLYIFFESFWKKTEIPEINCKEPFENLFCWRRSGIAHWMCKIDKQENCNVANLVESAVKTLNTKDYWDCIKNRVKVHRQKCNAFSKNSALKNKVINRFHRIISHSSVKTGIINEEIFFSQLVIQKQLIFKKFNESFFKVVGIKTWCQRECKTLSRASCCCGRGVSRSRNSLILLSFVITEEWAIEGEELFWIISLYSLDPLLILLKKLAIDWAGLTRLPARVGLLSSINLAKVPYFSHVSLV